MKKKLIWILAAVVVLAVALGLVLTQCQPQEPVAEAPTAPTVVEDVDNYDYNLEKALEYLRVFYKDTPEKTPMDYVRLGTVRVADSVYEIAWSVEFEEGMEVDPNLISIVVNEDGSISIDLNEDITYNMTTAVPYKLVATLTGTDGRVVSYTWDHIIPAGIDEEALAIVDAAYALKPGEALEGTHTLTGVIISIDEMYSEQYGNITVSMAVRGREDFPIKCYRLKGQGADKLAIGDTITVTGTLKNYKGIIEFDAGCILENVVSGGGTPPVAPEDPLEILKEAYKLKKGQSLPYECTLTGKISEIQYTWNEKYPNPTFEIVVQGQTGRPIKCYMVKGNEYWLKNIEVTDTVTLTGVITNYQGTIEFNRPTMTYWKRGPGLTQAVNYGSLEEGVAYKMYMDQKALGKTYYFNGSFDKYLGTTTNTDKAVDVYMEKVEGKGVRFYYMDGEVKTYIEIYLNSEGKPRPKTTTNPSIVFNYSKSAKTYCVMLDSQEYYLGTYSTYSTIAASSTFYITGENAGNRGKTQFLAKFVKSSEVDPGAGEEEVEPDILTGTAMTSAPTAGDVVVMANDTNGMTSLMLAETVSVEEGVLTGTTNLAQFTVEIDADGRYSFVSADGKYLTSGKTGSSLTLEATATNYSKWILEDNGDGTYNLKNYKAAYNAGGTSKPQYVEFYNGAFTTYSYQAAKADIYKISFYTDLVISSSGNEVVEAPVAGTAYYMMIDQKNLDKTLFFNGQTESGVSYRLATTENGAEAVQVYLEEVTGGYHLYFMNDGVKTYIRVYHRQDGDPGFGKGSLEFVTSAPAEVFTYNDTYDTLVYDYDGNNAYYMGTHSTYNTISVSNTSYLSSSTVDDTQFPIRFSLTANSDLPSDDEEEPGDEPIVGGDKVGTLITSAPADGDVIVIGNGSYIMTSNASGNKLAAETATVTDGTVPVTEAMAQLTVGIDANGYYTFTTADGKYLTSGATGNALSLEATANDYSLWTVTAATADTFYIKNVNAKYNGNVQSLEYYSGFTTYGHKDTAIYQMSLYEVSEAEEKVDGGVLMTTIPVAGDVIVVGNGSNIMTSNASGKKLAAEPGTATDGVLPLTETMAQLTVGIDANGYYTFTTADGKYLTSGATGNALSLEATANDYSLWTVTAATADTFYIKNVNAKYNGNVQSLEFYSGFTTYGHKDTAIYQMSLYKVTEGAGGSTGGSGESGGETTTVNYGPLKENTVYNLYMNQVTNGQELYFIGTMSGEYLATAEDAAEAVEVKMEKVEGEGVRFYFMNGDTKTYIEIYLNSNSKSRPALNTTPTCVYTYDDELGLYVVTLNGQAYYLGTYSTYDTISASSTYFITGSNAGTLGVTQFAAQCVLPEGSSGGSGETGGDSGDSTETTLTSGQYTLTASNGSVLGVVDGTWITAGDASSVWTVTIDGETATLCDANGVYIAPKGGNANGLSKAEYDWSVVKNDDDTYSFYGQGEDTVILAFNTDAEYLKFRAYKTATVSGNPEAFPSTFTLKAIGGDTGDDDTETPVDALEDNDYVIWVPGYNKALSSEKTGNYNVGVDVALVDGVLYGAGGTELWTVTNNEDGTVTISQGEHVLSMGDEYSSMTLDGTNDTWTLISLGDGLYNVQNVGRGNYIEWYNSYNNWSTYNSSSAASDKQFQIMFTPVDDLGEGDLPAEDTEEPGELTTLEQQLEAAKKLSNGTYLEVVTTITGTITDAPTESSYTAGTYKFNVSDGTNSVLCYYVPVTGGVPAMGDTVTVTGYLTAFNGTAEFDDTASAVLVAAAAAAEEPAAEDVSSTEETPAAEETAVVEEAAVVEETPVVEDTSLTEEVAAIKEETTE